MLSPMRRLLLISYLSWALSCFPGSAAEKPAKLPVWSDSVSARWWQEHPAPADWVDEADELRGTLVAMQTQAGTRWAMGHPDFRQWLRLAWWLDLFPADWAAHPLFSRAEIQQAFVRLGQQEGLSSRFLASLRPEDDRVEALAILCELHAVEPRSCLAYPALAVATALVWDQPVGAAWPHPFVEASQVPFGRETPLQRFQLYVESHQAGRLLYDPRRLSVNDLCFVISSPLEFTELAYGQAFKVKDSEQLWDLYRAVKYDEDRIDQARPEWPAGPYRLASIWERGGICADQAYLASTVFQAKGIPTILFLGQGVGGDHAWVGYRKPGGDWNLHIARYRSHNYPVGQAFHPQTRRRISDIELASYAQNLDQLDAWLRTRLFLGWARLNHEQPFYAELVIAARKLLPDLPETWELEEAWLLDHEAPPARLESFYQRWVSHFKGQASMRFRGQKALYRLYLDYGRETDAMVLKQLILKETKDARFDLGIHLASESVFREVERGNWDLAHTEFETTMKAFRGQAGGHLFYSLMQPYILACLEERQVKAARDAIDYARRFDLKRTTILGNDIRKLAERVGAARL